jgi:organic hydroperoxide reductase OsmC/OhrA
MDMPIAPFPHTYLVTLENTVLVEGTRPPIVVGAPSQFGGSDDVWSPEQLLLAAALACLKTTFDAYAVAEGITIHDWRGSATGVLVKGREGPAFERIELDVEITTAGDEARAQSAIDKAERRCIISRAIAAPIRVRTKITPMRAAAVG